MSKMAELKVEESTEEANEEELEEDWSEGFRCFSVHRGATAAATVEIKE